MSNTKHRASFSYSVVMSILSVYAVSLLVLLVFVPTLSFASERPLTALANTAGFQGNWEVFSKFNFVGKLLSSIISISCLIGLFMMMVRMIMTILYLSNKNIFNRIHQIKSSSKGNNLFGMASIGREMWQGNLGSGFDAFIGFIFSLAPDVFEYSDYASDAMSFNLSETDTVTQWALKVSLPYIMAIFFFSAGFNGTLFQAFATVSDAMMVAAERFVNTNLEQYVDRALNVGASYKFAYSAKGTEFGKFQQKVAKSLYAQAQRQCLDLSTESRYTIGGNVDKIIGTWLTEKAVDEMGIGAHVATNPNDAKNLRYEVIANTNATFGSSGSTTTGGGGEQFNTDYSGTSSRVKIINNVINVSASDLGLKSIQTSKQANNLYFHIVITKSQAADETEYFEPIKNQ